MNRLYWVRHGESFVNLTKEFSNRLVDKPLTPKGLLQAEQTAAYFVDKQIDAIYCSPLIRAVQTAQVIADRLGMPVTPLENFREMNVGDLEKVPPSDETWGIHRRIFEAWMNGDRSQAFPNGENGNELLSRIRAGVEIAIDDRDESNVLVVAHGGSFMAAVRDLCPEIALDWLKNQSVENCSVTEILFERVDGHLSGKLIRCADYSHLHDEAAKIVAGVPGANDFGGK